MKTIQRMKRKIVKDYIFTEKSTALYSIALPRISRYCLTIWWAGQYCNRLIRSLLINWIFGHLLITFWREIITRYFLLFATALVFHYFKGHGNDADFPRFLHKLVRHRSLTLHFEPFRFWLRIRGDIRNRKTILRLGESLTPESDSPSRLLNV
jgi:hypothetical protein